MPKQPTPRRVKSMEFLPKDAREFAQQLMDLKDLLTQDVIVYPSIRTQTENLRIARLSDLYIVNKLTGELVSHRKAGTFTEILERWARDVLRQRKELREELRKTIRPAAARKVQAKLVVPAWKISGWQIMAKVHYTTRADGSPAPVGSTLSSELRGHMIALPGADLSLWEGEIPALGEQNTKKKTSA